MSLRLVPRDLPSTGDAAAPIERCVTCGAPAGTPYCAQCGEQRAADRPRTVRAIADELWDAFSPIDGRIGRTMWSLVRRPGELTAAYVRGVRTPYVPPLRLFLIVNVLFFLNASIGERVRFTLPGPPPQGEWVGGNHTFDTPLWVHLNRTAHASFAKRLLEEHVPRDSTESRADYDRRIDAAVRPRFDAESTTQAKTLVIAMVPMFAALVWILSWPRRRSVLHDVVFATHATAVLLLVVIATQWLVALPVAVVDAALGQASSYGGQDLLVTVPTLLLFAWWLRAGLRRAYDSGAVVATMKAAALAMGFGLVLFAYRALLFVTTLYAI